MQLSVSFYLRFFNILIIYTFRSSEKLKARTNYTIESYNNCKAFSAECSQCSGTGYRVECCNSNDNMCGV